MAELIYPTLRAVDGLGGSAERGYIIAALTEMLRLPAYSRVHTDERPGTVRHRNLKSIAAAALLSGGLMAVAPAVDSGAVSAVPTFTSVPLSSSIRSGVTVAYGTAPDDARIVVYSEPQFGRTKMTSSATEKPISRANVLHGHWVLKVPARRGPISSRSSNYSAIMYTATGAAIAFFTSTAGDKGSPTLLTQWTPMGRTRDSSSPLRGGPGCQTHLRQNLGLRDTLVGETFSSDKRAWNRFTYTTGATTEVGVAVSPTGAAGSFSQSGTQSQTATMVQRFFGYSGPYYTYEFAAYQYGLFVKECGGGYTKWYTQATGLTTGASQRTVGGTPYAAHVCALEPAQGFQVTVDRSRALTWSNGLVLEGIGLSTQTGFTSDGSVTQRWPSNYSRSSPNRNCGVHAAPDLDGSLIAVARGV